MWKDSNLSKVQSFTLETAANMKSTIQCGPLEIGTSFETWVSEVLIYSLRNSYKLEVCYLIALLIALFYCAKKCFLK